MRESAESTVILEKTEVWEGLDGDSREIAEYLTFNGFVPSGFFRI